MEKITDSLIVAIPENEKHSALIPSNERWPLIPNPPDDPRAEAILEIIVQVEMAKQLTRPITDQERNVLMRLLADTGETIPQLKERALKVIHSRTYGNIAFEHWDSDEEVITVKTLKADCKYCGSEWWGGPESKCPVCFPVKTFKESKDEPPLTAPVLAMVGAIGAKIK